MQTDRSGEGGSSFSVVEAAATPAMRSCLAQAYRAAQIKLGIAAGVPLVLVLVAIVADSFLFAALAFIVVVGLNTPKAALRAFRLRRAQTEPAIVRVRGPVAVTRHRRNGSQSFALYYRAWVKRSAAMNHWGGFDIDESEYNEVAQAATVIPDERPGLFKLFSAVWRHEVPDAISTYSRTGHVLLDVRYLDGVAIYCHPGYEGEEWGR